MLPPVRKRILSRVPLLERKFYASSMSIQSSDTSCQDDRTLLLYFRVDACPQHQAPAGEGQIFPWRIPHTASECFAREIDVICQEAAIHYPVVVRLFAVRSLLRCWVSISLMPRLASSSVTWRRAEP